MNVHRCSSLTLEQSAECRKRAILPRCHSHLQDIISDDDTRVKLQRHAQHWRGVAEPSYSDPHILPPTYSLHIMVHTAAPITSHRLFNNTLIFLLIRSPQCQCVCLSGHADTLRVSFWTPIGRGLGFQTGWQSRPFARSGCRPNAVLRPLLCDDSKSQIA
jgi:hypothetical protein